MTSPIEVTRVTARYGRRRPVLDDLTWTAREGRTILLGPNGAGKSTLLKVLAGVVEPASGQVAAAGAVGYMPQTVRAVPGLTVLDQVGYVAWLQGMPQRAAAIEAHGCLERVGLADLASERATRLSGGQLRRVGLAQALVGSPPVLLLDEPTAGLDPAQRIAFAGLLRGLGGAVVVATHQVDEMEETYDAVGVLQQGRFVFDGPLADFLALDTTGNRSPVAAYASLAQPERGVRSVG